MLQYLFMMPQFKCYLKSAPSSDLAEAHYQLGLTFAQKGDIEKSQENFDTAIQLFHEMQAPLANTKSTGGFIVILIDHEKLG